MLALRQWKEWKKKLKRRRRPSWSLAAVAVPVLFMALPGAAVGAPPAVHAASVPDGAPSAESTDFTIDGQDLRSWFGGDPNKDHALRPFLQLGIRALESSVPEKRAQRSVHVTDGAGREAVRA